MEDLLGTCRDSGVRRKISEGSEAMDSEVMRKSLLPFKKNLLNLPRDRCLHKMPCKDQGVKGLGNEFWKVLFRGAG